MTELSQWRNDGNRFRFGAGHCFPVLLSRVEKIQTAGGAAEGLQRAVFGGRTSLVKMEAQPSPKIPLAFVHAAFKIKDRLDIRRGGWALRSPRGTLDTEMANGRLSGNSLDTA
jgi:hypothetical protein